MGRPASTVLASHTDRRWTRTDILSVAATYQVVYKGEAFALRREDGSNDKRHYLRTSFPLPAHAQRLADKLNAMFKTADFSVRVIA